MSPHPYAVASKPQIIDIDTQWYAQKRSSVVGLKAIIDKYPDKDLNALADATFQGLHKRSLDRIDARNGTLRAKEAGQSDPAHEKAYAEAANRSTDTQRALDSFAFAQFEKARERIPKEDADRFIAKVIGVAARIHKDVLDEDIHVARTSSSREPAY
ncbi:MAG: hypothetical protein WDN72_01985 [Alphaproteobacteria bacterium]